MKKLTTVCLFLCSAIALHPQDSIYFKQNFKPGKHYDMTSNSLNYFETKITGPDSLVKALTAKGKDVLTKKEQQVNLKWQMETANEKMDNGDLKFRTTLLRARVGDDSTSLPAGTIFLGRVLPASMQFDSIQSDVMSDDVKKQVLPLLQKMLGKITIPEKTLKVGESFSHELPVQIPVAGEFVKFNITTVYKLVKIHDGKAQLVLTQTYKMEPTTGHFKITARGDGDGEVIFDIANSSYISFINDGKIYMHGSGQAEVDVNIRTHMEQVTLVSEK
jgi:hypothetical protein